MALHKKIIPQNHYLGKGEGLTTTKFYEQRSTKSEVLEVCTITGVVPARLRDAPSGEGGRKPRSKQCDLRIPLVTWGETVTLLGVHLGVLVWPPQGQKKWQHQYTSLFTSKGTKKLAEGNKP